MCDYCIHETARICSARCTTLKNHFLWVMWGCMTLMSISKYTKRK